MISKKLAVWLSVIVSQGLFISLLPIWLKLFTYLHPVVLIVVWFCQTIFIFFLIFLVTGNTMSISKRIVSTFIFLYSCSLLILLFFRPSNQEYQTYNLVPFKTFSSYLSGEVSFLIAFYNLAANVLLFIPFGVFAMIIASKEPASNIKRFVLPIIMITLIEVLQFLTKRGSLDVDDLILNVFGVYAGYGLSRSIKKVLRID
ncbi:VanZ family protein [Bacillus salipaludis]|uniref:VanZ family protein n=1 Tax=Bacillus salipaludis TaxID=2547811 RepID=UPI002E244021|nr:VanZ family protein [Bacillus salipaludis]